jgi:hypothetical protein
MYEYLEQRNIVRVKYKLDINSLCNNLHSVILGKVLTDVPITFLL